MARLDYGHIGIYNETALSLGDEDGSALATNSRGELIVPDYFTEVGSGTVPGVTPLLHASQSPFIGTSFKTIWDVDGELSFPTAAETWEIVSSSTEDNPVGTGTVGVFITSLDGDYVTQSQVVFLNGTTPVTLSGTHIRHQQTIQIAAGSNEFNVGDITIRVSGGGAVRARLLAGNGRTYHSYYTVPAGTVLVGTQVSAYTPKNEDAVISTQVRPLGGGWVPTSPDITVYNSSFVLPLKAGSNINEKTDLRVRAKSTNTDVTVGFILEGVIRATE